jgi:hypothetical protein
MFSAGRGIFLHQFPHRTRSAVIDQIVKVYRDERLSPAGELRNLAVIHQR